MLFFVDAGGGRGDYIAMSPNPLCPSLSFRFWCGAAGCYVQDYRYSGKVEELFEHDGVLVPQQCTGLRDCHGNWVYEADTVEIPIEEAGGKMAFLVERDPCEPCNIILVGRSEQGLEVHKPLAAVRSGKITRCGFSDQPPQS